MEASHSYIKLNPPHGLSNALIRSRFQSISNFLSGEYQVVSVIAPAGYGKSTLLSHWHYALEKKNIPSGWLSLDDDDNVPSRFLEYFILALQKLLPMFGEKIKQIIKSGDISTFDPLLKDLINELWQLDLEGVLFIDDIHVITDHEVLDLFARLINQLPPTICFVLAGRGYPELGFGKLRVQQQLLEYDANNIRFTFDEMKAFLGRDQQFNLGHKTLELLFKKTEGWIVALQLISLVLKKIDNPGIFVEIISGRDKDITDYLAEVILNQQSEEVKSFLLKTSVLDSFCGELCDATLNMNKSQFLLNKIESLNLFLIPLDRERNWYRYHHLFQEFLKNQLEINFPQEIKPLYHRASLWYEKKEQILEAINYALTSRDYEHGMRLLSNYGFMLVAYKGEYRAILRWSKLLPKQYVDQPFIQIGLCFSLLLLHDYNKAEELVRKLELNLNAQDGFNQTLVPVEIDFITSLVEAYKITLALLQDKLHVAKQVINRWLSKWSSENMWEILPLVKMSLGTYYLLSYDLKTAEQVFNDCSKNTVTKINVNYFGLVSGNLGFICCLQGQFKQAIDMCQHDLNYVTNDIGKHSSSATMIAIVMSAACYEIGDIEQAKKILTDYQVLLDIYGAPFVLLLGYMVLLRVHVYSENYDKASFVLSDLEKIFQQRLNQRSQLMLNYLHICLLMKANEYNKAELMARENNFLSWKGSDFSDDYMEAHFQELSCIIQARLALVNGNIDESIARLNSIAMRYESQNRIQEMMPLLILKVQGLHQLQRCNEAFEQLIYVLKIGQRCGFVQVFIEEGSGIQYLINEIYHDKNKVREFELQPNYLKNLLSAYAIKKDMVFANKIDLQLPQKGLLTDREASIIILLNSDLHHQKIADKLEISINTLRWNLRNIYRKLNVRNRVGAIMKARQLNIIT